MAVLIVDDDPINLKLLSYLLRAIAPAPALEFADPLAALNWCAAHAPELVIVDYLMPGLSGLEFIERLRLLPGKEGVPVIMISADSDEALRGKAMRLGVGGFLSKPIDKTALHQQARRLLARRGE
jgi:putative two-component system response regulator